MFDKLKAAGAATALALALGAAPGLAQAATNLVTNGGFETGDFNGWTTNAVSYPQSIFTYPVHEGLYAAQFEGFSFDPNTLSQLLSTTLGQSYTLSFWYFQDIRGAESNGIDVTWNGSSLYSATNEAFLGYRQFTATVLGTGSDALVFTAYNNTAHTLLDDVSVYAAVSAVPEPATWAMMIVGFGAAGSMVRAARRRNAFSAA